MYLLLAGQPSLHSAFRTCFIMKVFGVLALLSVVAAAQAAPSPRDVTLEVELRALLAPMPMQVRNPLMCTVSYGMQVATEMKNMFSLAGKWQVVGGALAGDLKKCWSSNGFAGCSVEAAESVLANNQDLVYETLNKMEDINKLGVDLFKCLAGTSRAHYAFDTADKLDLVA